MQLEIAVQDLAGYTLAAELGADCVELCCALGPTGGLTPSMGLIDTLAADGRLPINVLIRPRPGNFVYTDAELAVMRRDIHRARAAGATGVVLGALTTDSTLDLTAMHTLLTDLPPGTIVTFHRAFDLLSPAARESALSTLDELGCTRILTSGGAGRVGEGIAELCALQASAGSRLQILAGGGLAAADIPTLARGGITAVHASAKSTRRSAPVGPGGGAADVEYTDRSTLMALRTAIRATHHGDPVHL